jgi:hypothetical protein
MALSSEPCSETNGAIKKPRKEWVCQWVKTKGRDLSRNDSQRVLKVLYI